MASESLIRVIHDLRGPLNTLAILGEVLRSSEAGTSTSHREAIQSTNRTINNLGTMLARVRECADTMTSQLAPVDLDVAIQSAIAATTSSGIEISFASDAQTVVYSCPERLPVTLANLLACCAAALPSGGRLILRVEAASRATRLTVTLEGPAVQFPPANSYHKLSPVRSGPADWFALFCRVEGLGGTLSICDDSTSPSVSICFPICP